MKTRIMEAVRIGITSGGLIIGGIVSISGFMSLGVASVAQAGFPETWERWERIHGAGWGDGYHACRPSGIRPFADLPPVQTPPTTTPAWHRSGATLNTGATYYDRFDARCAGIKPPAGVEPRAGGAREPARAGYSVLDRSVGDTEPVAIGEGSGRAEAGHQAESAAARSAAARQGEETVPGVRPGLSGARLPRANVAHKPIPPRESKPPSDRSPSLETRRSAPRIAEIPERLIIRQPR